MIVTVGVREEVTTDRRELRSCCVQTSMKSLKVIRQSPETSLKRNNVETTSTSSKAFDPFWGSWRLEILPQVHLDVEFWVLVEVVEELLVVVELHVPLAGLRVPKVVPERYQKNRRAKETRLLAVLIQQEKSSEGQDREPLGLLIPPPWLPLAPPSLTSP